MTTVKRVTNDGQQMVVSGQVRQHVLWVQIYIKDNAWADAPKISAHTSVLFSIILLFYYSKLKPPCQSGMQ